MESGVAPSGGLASVPAGPALCARLSQLEAGAVEDEPLLALLSAEARQLGYQQARVWAVLTEIAHRDPMPAAVPRLSPEQRCVFAGCRRPATSCDQDHRHDYARGGQTAEHNLEPACRHDHANKTERGWRLVQLNPHTYCWISPLGRRHIVQVNPIAPALPTPIPRDARPAKPARSRCPTSMHPHRHSSS